MNVSYSDIFSELKATINFSDDKPTLKRVYDTSQDLIDEFDVENQIEKEENDYTKYIDQLKNDNKEEDYLIDIKNQTYNDNKETFFNNGDLYEKNNNDLYNASEVSYIEDQQENVDNQQDDDVEGQQENVDNKQDDDVEGQQENVDNQQNDIEDQQNDIEDQQNDIEDQQNDIEDQQDDIEDQQNDIKDQKNDVKDQQNDIKDQKNDVEDQQNDINNQKNKIELPDIEESKPDYNHFKLAQVEPIKVKDINSINNLFKENNKNEKLSNNLGQSLTSKKQIVENIDDYLNRNNIKYRTTLKTYKNKVLINTKVVNKQDINFKLNKNEELINENINVYEQNGIINTIIIRNVKDKEISNKKEKTNLKSINKVVYRYINIINQHTNEIIDVIKQSVVFNGELKDNKNVWLNKKLKFEEVSNLPIIDNMVSQQKVVPELEIDAYSYKDKEKIDYNVYYKDLYEIINRYVDKNVIFINEKTNEQFDYIKHFGVEKRMVKNLKTNEDFEVINSNVKDNNILEELNKYIIKNYKNIIINDFNETSKSLIVYCENNKKEIKIEKEVENEMAFKPVKKEFLNAFNKVNKEIPKLYQKSKYLEFESIKPFETNDMSSQNDILNIKNINDRYNRRFLEHVNNVRKELKLKKIELKELNDNEFNDLFKTLQNISNQKDFEKEFIDYKNKYINKNNIIFNFNDFVKVVGVGFNLPPEALADRDFKTIVEKVNQYEYHKDFVLDKEINSLIREKVNLISILNVLNIYNLSNEKSNKHNKYKIAYEYSNIKIIY